MEFFYLAYQTGDPQFADKPMEVFKMLRDNNDPEDGLYAAHLNTNTLQFASESFILFDSFF